MLRVRSELMIAFSAGIFLLGGCQREEKTAQSIQPAAQAEAGKPESAALAARTAVAELRPTEGNQAAGKVTFTTSTEGVEIVIDMQGLAPGKHGIHIHEKGDCSAPDARSAGGHFNPDGAPHGGPDQAAGRRHVGDLGNIEAGPDGTASYRRVDSLLQFEGTNAIVGKAVVVHSGADDFVSQPAGNSGQRIACGVIELSTGPTPR